MKLALAILFVACSGKDHMSSEAMQRPRDEPAPAPTTLRDGQVCTPTGTKCTAPATCRDGICQRPAAAK